MAKYTVKWGYYEDLSQECETWDQVKQVVRDHAHATNLTVIGADYDVGGPDERVYSGLTDDEEQELETLLS
jgi:hypothetical protein